MYQYRLTIPVQIPNDEGLIPDQACSLIDRQMQAYTQEVVQFQADRTQYPDLLAKFILDKQLKAAVAAITYDHAEFHDDAYTIGFQILANRQFDQNLTEQLIEFMTGQMSDGLLENGLLLLEQTSNPSRNTEDQVGEANGDVIMWPEWISTDHYVLTKLTDWFSPTIINSKERGFMITEVFLATINFPTATEQAVYTDSLDQTEKIVMQSLDTFLFDYRQKHPDCQIKMLARHQAKQFNVELADHGRQIVTGQIQTYPVNISNLAPISEEDLWF